MNEIPVPAHVRREFRTLFGAACPTLIHVESDDSAADVLDSCYEAARESMVSRIDVDEAAHWLAGEML